MVCYERSLATGASPVCMRQYVFASGSLHVNLTPGKILNPFAHSMCRQTDFGAALVALLLDLRSSNCLNL